MLLNAYLFFFSSFVSRLDSVAWKKIIEEEEEEEEKEKEVEEEEEDNKMNVYSFIMRYIIYPQLYQREGILTIICFSNLEYRIFHVDTH